MEAKHKTAYEAPLAEAFEVKTEGVICNSQQPSNTMSREDYDYEEW